jgi:hypothetical protein
LSGLILKVVMILFSLRGYGFVFYWCGVVIEPESASRLDEFVVHFRVGVLKNRFRMHLAQTDYLLIVELNALAALEC